MPQKQIFALLKNYSKSTVSYLELGSMGIPFQEMSAKGIYQSHTNCAINVLKLKPSSQLHTLKAYPLFFLLEILHLQKFRAMLPTFSITPRSIQQLAKWDLILIQF